MRITWVLLILSLILAISFAQDSSESEETSSPKKVLRKYRVRRPVQSSTNAENGDAPVKNSPRVRRIRIKQPRPTPVVIEATPQNLLTARYAGAGLPTAVQAQPQQVVYDEQQVVDPVRVVPNYRQATPSSTRSALLANVNLRDRDHEDNKKPVVGTTRNYSHINEDGSFTFGYEAEDGSFKEETRGTDCVVRGKYGYVDPSGVRREFAYVSGNPCDPNDPNRGELQDEEDADEESAPPTRAGIRQRIPVERRPALINSNVQQSIEQTVEERIPEDQVFRPQVLRRVRPQPQPQTQTQRPDVIPITTFRPRIRITQSTPQPPSAIPTSAVPEGVVRAFPQFRQSVSSTLSPRPLIEPNQDLSLDRDRGSRSFNFQQELQEIAGPNQLQHLQQQPEVAAQQQQQIQYRQLQPQPQYHQSQQRAPIHTFPQRQHFGSQAGSVFEQHRQQLQPQQQIQPQDQNEIKPEQQQPTPNFGRYRTELVFDPASGQYTNVVVQEAPKSNEEFTLTQRLRAYADPQRPNQFQFQQYEQPRLNFFNQPPLGQHYHYQQQPIQYHGGQGLQTSAATQTVMSLHPDAQQISNSAATGQIDAFLRTLNFA